MKRLGLFLLTVVLALGVIGCGGGGDDDDQFDFNGQWTYQAVVTSSNVEGVSVGMVINDVATIKASGTTISVDFPGDIPAAVGTCDPVVGTFRVTVVHDGISLVMNGYSTSTVSMAGDETWTMGTSSTVFSWTMTLASRTAAAPAAGLRDRWAETLAKAAGAAR